MNLDQYADIVKIQRDLSTWTGMSTLQKYNEIMTIDRYADIVKI